VRGEDFAIYLITGVMLYHIFSRGTAGGLISLTSNSGIIKSVRVDKKFFPLTSTAATIILAGVDIMVFILLMPIFQFTPSWTIILLPIPLILLFVLIQGISYFLSVVNVFVRDIQYIWIIFTHALLFVSPVFWNLSDIKGGPLLAIHKINPLGQLIELSHKIVIDKTIPPINEWLYTTGIIVAVFILGYFVFQALKNKVTEEL